jgi:pilus assembly protein CpaC
LRPFIAAAVVVFSLFTQNAVAQIDIEKEVEYKRRILLDVGQSKVISLTGDITRMAIPDDAPFDAIAVTTKQVLITGYSAGTGMLTLFDRADKPLPILIEVVADFSGLQSQLKALYPKENITVSSDSDKVVLSGSVTDARTIDEVEKVAQLYSPSVVNLLRPAGGQQVQLEIKFAEVNRTALREMGFSLFGTNNGATAIGGIFGSKNPGGGFIGTAPANGAQGVPGTSAAGNGLPPVVPSGSFAGAFHFLGSFNTPIPLSFTLDLLNSEGLSRTLAEPTLVSMSGEKARFLAGGEFPIPTNAANGQISTEFKQFGIVMEFAPIVLGGGIMQLAVVAEVSDIDFAAGITTGVITIPGLTSRRIETVVRLRDGESFAVAGLLSNRTKSLVEKVPLLGDIPVLGALFRSTQYRQEETELLVVITPRLVEALPTMPELPGERMVNHPSDLELFLLGRGLRERRAQNSASISMPNAMPAKAEMPLKKFAEPAGAIGFVH